METENPFENPELKELINKYTPYLKEIRKRLLVTLALFVVGALIGFNFYEKIIKFLIEILSLKGINIVFTSPFQFINLAISCGIATGLVLIFPLLIFQTLSFLRPALRHKEFRLVTRLLPFSILLFFIGFAFGFMIMKWQIEIFLAKSISLGIGNILDISPLISSVLIVSTLMGIAFQFPILLLLFSWIGVISAKELSKKRLWVYLGSLIFAIMLPPDSIIADIFLALPLIILFELSLILDRIIVRKKVVAPLL